MAARKKARTKFSDFVAGRMKELGLSAYTLAKNLGVSRSSVGNWLRDNRWNRAVFRALCREIGAAEAAGVASLDPAVAQQTFDFEWKSADKDTSSSERDGLARRFDTIDRKLRTARRAMAKVAGEVGGLLDRVGPGDALFVWTATIVPMIYRTNASHGIAEHARASLAEGAVICVFGPSQTLYDEYVGRGYARADLVSPDQFLDLFGEFERWCADCWAAEGVPAHEVASRLDRRIGQFLLDGSPFFTPGFTFSLLGEVLVNPERKTAFRAMMRVPSDAYGGAVAFPKDDLLEERLRSTALGHLVCERKKLAEGPGGSAARRDYIDTLIAILTSDHKRLGSLAKGADNRPPTAGNDGGR